MSGVAYNPDDPLQQAFLNALSLGETGGVADSAEIGVGGTNLSDASVDQYGFPQWNGQGNSHAAGTYQFEPSTWDSIAQEYGLNFSSSTDQSEGAWYLAEQTDPNIYSQLQTGDYSSIQSALKSVWPSVTGNGAAPQGLASNIAKNADTNINAQTAQTNANNASSLDAGTDPVSAVLGGFSRLALIVIGGIIIFVALWMLLSQTGYVPSPKDVGKSIIGV